MDCLNWSSHIPDLNSTVLTTPELMMLAASFSPSLGLL
jgi:hypothetical protein